jgi:hypothetical protein
VDEPVAVKMLERGGQGEAEADAFIHRQAAAQKEFAPEITRGVGVGLERRLSSQPGFAGVAPGVRHPCRPPIP